MAQVTTHKSPPPGTAPYPFNWHHLTKRHHNTLSASLTPPSLPAGPNLQHQQRSGPREQMCCYFAPAQWNPIQKPYTVDGKRSASSCRCSAVLTPAPSPLKSLKGVKWVESRHVLLKNNVPHKMKHKKWWRAPERWMYNTIFVTPLKFTFDLCREVAWQSRSRRYRSLMVESSKVEPLNISIWMSASASSPPGLVIIYQKMERSPLKLCNRCRTESKTSKKGPP